MCTHPFHLPYFYLLLAFIPHREAACSYAAASKRYQAPAYIFWSDNAVVLEEC